MIVIIEGPNGSGKSTLLNHLYWQSPLCKKLNTKRQPGNTELKEEHLAFDEELYNLPNDGIYLLDRHSTSDWVYGHIHDTNLAQMQLALDRIDALAEKQYLAYVQLMVFPDLKGKSFDNGRVQWSAGQYATITKAYEELWRIMCQKTDLAASYVLESRPGVIEAMALLRNLEAVYANT